MQALIDMGIDTSKASMCWIIEEDGNHNLTFNRPIGDKPLLPTFTLQDILEMLPRELKPFAGNKSWKKVWPRLLPYAGDRWCMEYENPDELFYQSDGDNPLDAAFNMLKLCKENKHI